MSLPSGLNEEKREDISSGVPMHGLWLPLIFLIAFLLFFLFLMATKLVAKVCVINRQS